MTAQLQSLVTIGVAVVGGILALLSAHNHNRLCILISLSAGALMGTACFNLVPESIEIAGWLGVAMVGVGYFAFTMLGRRFHHICPACSASHTENLVNLLSLVPLMSALMLHNLMDGMALSSGPQSGAFLAVLIHKLPEGIALAMILQNGLQQLRPQPTTILVILFGVEFNTFLGTLLGDSFLPYGPLVPGLILGLVSGGFMFLGEHAFKGEFRRGCRNLVVVCFVIGILIYTHGGKCH